jgi:fumarylacetoacetase
MNVDIELEVSLTPEGAEPTVISRSNFAHMYWSSAQQFVHHAIGGCAVNVGDILGSGTISGPTPGSYGSLLELSWNGKTPLAMTDGSTRSFLLDGDTLAIRGRARRGEITLGFGACDGTILPAPAFD